MEAENQPRVSPAKSGLLSVVGTPIGNLSDASPRVLDTLATADVIFCEDTRVTSKLLSAFGLHASLQRCDENVIEAQIAPALKRLAQGQHLAFVSDAGMPGVSDPGQRLVDAVLDAGFATEVVPGPSAVTCALVASGLASEHFFFEGFLPRKHGAQKDRLVQLATIPATLVIYESPRRVAATLATISEVMPRRRLALVRELTKVHEEVVRGLAPELAATVAAREHLKGECVIVVSAPKEHESEEGSKASKTPMSLSAEQTLADAIQAGLEAGERKSTLAKRLSKSFSLDRDVVYEAILKAVHTS